MIDPKKISVVIPVHNRKDFTLACLHSLRRQTVSGGSIVLVDDGSTDGTALAVREEFPEATLLSGDGNLWWTASMNLGVTYALNAGAEYVISLNNDLEIAEDYLEKMIFWAGWNPQAILGSYGFDIATRTPDYGGEWMEWKMKRTVKLLDRIPEEQRHGLHEVTHFPGRGLWIPAAVFNAIGLFDARWLPHYGADDDFTLRARKKGFAVYCNYDARLFSHVRASGDADNRKRYCLKNYFNHLFGIKGGGNLKNFSVLAFRHCPLRRLWYYWPYGIAARVGGYLRDWVKTGIKTFGR
jgi:GT2 family glycosyltransferase